MTSTGPMLEKLGGGAGTKHVKLMPWKWWGTQKAISKIHKNGGTLKYSELIENRNMN